MEWLYILMPIAGVKIFWPGLIILGIGVGVIGGFFGMGGAWMVTPGLNILGFPMAFAIGTDIAHMAGKSLISTMRHGKFGNVDYKLGFIMLFGTVAGLWPSCWRRLAMKAPMVSASGPVQSMVPVCSSAGPSNATTAAARSCTDTGCTRAVSMGPGNSAKGRRARFMNSALLSPPLPYTTLGRRMAGRSFAWVASVCRCASAARLVWA